MSPVPYIVVHAHCGAKMSSLHEPGGMPVLELCQECGYRRPAQVITREGGAFHFGEQSGGAYPRWQDG